MIPEQEDPETISQFRPMSLCNLNVKILTKVIANRLKPLLVKLVDATQSSFISGYLGIDNTIVGTRSASLYMKEQREKGYMVLKLELEKAYDRI